MASSQIYDEAHLHPGFRVKIDGSDLPVEIANDIQEIVVEQSVHMPDACTIRLFDWDIARNQFKWVDDSRLKEGKSVEVMMGYEHELATVFKGEMTMFEMDAAGHMVPSLLIHCVSKEHRLHRNRVRKTYQEVTDSDIVSQVAGRCGLNAQADSMATVRHWVCQNNQTDYEFLKMLADRNGCRMYVDGSTLHFKKVDDPQSADATLEWGNNLRSFRPRLTTHGMVDEVSVRGWDTTTKQGILSTKTTSDGKSSAAVGEGKKGGQAARSAFSSDSKHAIVDLPVNSQSEADSIAQSAIDKRETGFIEGDGLCAGSPIIAAGKTVEVKGVGDRFSGKYNVTSATHTFTPAEGYTTQFKSGGTASDAIVDILGAGKSVQSNKINFIVLGIVTDNQDPDNLGRIKVKYPWLSDDETSYWVRVAAPMGGNNRGFMYLPEIDDEVLIAFEHGDIHFPYMLGGLWNGVDKPPLTNDKAVEGGKVRHRIIQTRYGHVFDFDDNGCITLTTKGGQYLFESDAQMGGVQLKSKSGHTVIIQETKGIKVATQGGHKVVLNDEGQTISMKHSGGSSITMESSGDIIITAQANLHLIANAAAHMSGMSGVTIESSAGASIAGQAGTWVTSSGIVTVNGSMTMINSPGPPAPPAPPVVSIATQDPSDLSSGQQPLMTYGGGV